MSSYVLDAFALLAYFKGEPGRARVEELLGQAEAGTDTIAVTVVNLGEMYYRLQQSFGEAFAAQALLRLSELPIEVVDVDSAIALQAANAKAQRRMGYLDCFAFSLAYRLGATVVTGDDDFKAVEDLVAIDWLPQPARG